MKGRRLPTIDGKVNWPTEPGDYCGPVVFNFSGGPLPAVFFLKPNARDVDAPKIAHVIHHVVSPPHVFTEETDGTLTISPSLSDRHREMSELSDGWHGFLEKGIWREVSNS